MGAPGAGAKPTSTNRAPRCPARLTLKKHACQPKIFPKEITHSLTWFYASALMYRRKEIGPADMGANAKNLSAKNPGASEKFKLPGDVRLSSGHVIWIGRYHEC